MSAAKFVRRRQSGEYIRLQFLVTLYEQCYNKCNSIYDSLRTWVVPNFADETVDKIEKQVTDFACPVYNKLEQLTQTSLQYLDEKIDYVASAVEEKYAKQKDEWDDNMKRFQEARNNYLEKVEEGALFVKDNGLIGTFFWFIGFWYHFVLKIVTNIFGGTMKFIQSIWERFMTSPQVDKVVKTAQPSVEYARSLYDSAHETVVKDPRYMEAYKRGQNLVNRVKDTGLYKSVQPYVDPTVERIQNISYYNKAVDHLKPVDNNVHENDQQSSTNSDVQMSDHQE